MQIRNSIIITTATEILIIHTITILARQLSKSMEETTPDTTIM